ncbi:MULTISPECIES: hypothetical protein [Tritonibacter]|uniref:Uncharacterized protein n=1 Tax=Tritonibacter scottomollicae TaxID=483013 RepID=A0A2T1AP38_TRISK|nr:hypothetical protein [Tritonibacter scottomollicae]PRZ50332.1 hypothetical protein CLV89_101552 [Tritonibacter scottomollicae]
MKTLKAFRASEDGAISVDWVVLTAAMAALCALTAKFMSDETFAHLNSIVEYMRNLTF